MVSAPVELSLTRETMDALLSTAEASIRQIFEAPGLAELSEGGMLTGAGGGGFALLVSREDADVELKKRLGQLKERKPYGRSAVVDYRLNRRGLHLEERPV